MLRGNRLAVIEVSVPPRDPTELLLAHPAGFGDVPFAQGVQRRHSRPVFTQHRFLGAAVETGKMVEHHSPAANHQVVRCSFDSAAGEIPRGHVVHRVAEDHAAGKKSGRQIGPSLVRKKSARNIVKAEVAEPVAPPVREPSPFDIVLDPDEAKIVDAMTQNGELIVQYCVVGSFRLRQMGSEEHRSGAECRDKFVQRSKHNHVGIEIEHLRTGRLL
ncbi:MAG: hypothetical protein NTW28_32075 [Candidatus Solibacter sp.]|nr:hypothetical protein [Candidatus Solibacter sp.]